MRPSTARAALTALLAATVAACAAPAGGGLTVGSQHLERCATPGAACGRLERPLDPTGRVPGTVPVYFEYYPALGPGPVAGTLVATEGGPGYPATLSRADYLALFAPLRADHDVVLMDNRGTGRSGVVDCPALQEAAELTRAAIGACGASLGARAPLYSTAYAADDLEAVLASLGRGRVDLYGDSYGTFFAQVFAVRHPERLRSLVLDGAYPLDGPDLAWYPAYAPAMRAKFERACERAPACASLPGGSLARLTAALERLRAQPFPTAGTDVDGARRQFTAGPAALAVVLFGAAPPLATLRDADAAARAYLGGDALPLTRLMAEALAAVDSRDPSHAPAAYSAGLAAAVTCQDTPQIFDMRLAPPARRAARERLLAERRARAPDTYAPFTIDEFLGMPPDYSFIDECVEWPAAEPAHPPAYRAPDGRGFPDVPVLVLSGEFDNMTTLADGTAAAAQFPHSRHVVLANSFHVNALPRARSTCGAELARRFIATLDPGDTGCAAAVPTLRLAPPFARRAAAVAAATPLAGNGVDAAGLAVAAAALATAGDLVPRLAANASGHGVGLRGGRYTVRAAGEALSATLARVRWTEDLEVSGMLTWQPRDGAGAATLTFAQPGGARGEVHARWPAGGSEVRATLTGTIDGRPLAAEAPAP